MWEGVSLLIGGSKQTHSRPSSAGFSFGTWAEVTSTVVLSSLSPFVGYSGAYVNSSGHHLRPLSPKLFFEEL